MYVFVIIMLSSIDIKKWMINEPSFVGVFPINELPKVSDSHSEVKFIVNTDSANLPGMHWIAVWRKPQGKAEIFDSYAIYPPAEVQLWCNANCSQGWQYNSWCIQSPTSRLCGFYCCLFLTMRAKFSTMSDCVGYLAKIV